jgi:dienelactone hydrolase
MKQLPDRLSYSAFIEQETSRILFEGALPGDLTRILSTIEEEADWISQWGVLASSEERAARLAQEEHRLTTARQRYLRAGYYYRLAHYFLMRDCEERRSLVAGANRCCGAGIAFGEPRVEAVTIPYAGRFANGYLHFPTGQARPPCVVCIPGLGHTKESMHSWCTEGARRGLAVFVGDGPGYGDARTLRGERLGASAFDQYLEGVLEFLARDKRLDGHHVGLLGDCFGGLLALRAASRDRRFKACAALEAILDDPAHTARTGPIPPLVLYHLLESDLSLFVESGQVLAEAGPQIRCPVYLIHAETDELVPLSVARAVLGLIRGPTQLDVVPGPNCYANHLRNHYNAVLDHLGRWVPSAFDWLAAELAVARA